MALDRIGTRANAQLVVARMLNAESRLDQSNRQVSSGRVADTYSGYAGKTAALEAARMAAVRTEADIATAKEASRRLDLQDNLLGQLSDLANEVRQTITDAVASDNGATLMTELEGLYERASQILNAQDGDSYIFGGERDSAPPVAPATLADLAALPSATAAFANGTVKRTMRIGQNQMIEVGALASDLGGQLFALFRNVAQFDAGVNGPFGISITPAQRDFLSSAINTAATAANGVSVQAASNGFKYGQVQSAMEHLKATGIIHQGFVSSIEDVDMAEAVARLTQNQMAFQASLQVTAKLHQLTLLDFLPLT